LVSEVALTKAGIVMGLEVSRLARNSADWHRLIELCALTGTLILDEDGVYDPASFNDRLLLGLKGTMSEAELHILRARMRGGQLNKARRGELEIGPPVGLIYRSDGRLDLDPDAEVQAAIRLVFDTFERTGSATRTVRFFLDQGILFPRRLRKEPNKGELLWAPPRHSRILQVLHNPRYAGAFVYGRTRGRRSRTAASLRSRCPWRIGNSSCQISIRGTSTGNASRPTKRDFLTTDEPMGFSADQDPCERDLACFKAASCAASVVSEWAFATAWNTVKRS
jgi:DNA invertase Pin-like site-specific DNA recombinase